MLDSILNPTPEHAIMALVVLAGVIAHAAVTWWERSERRRAYRQVEEHAAMQARLQSRARY